MKMNNYCTKCGGKIDYKYNYCPFCGNKILNMYSDNKNRIKKEWEYIFIVLVLLLLSIIFYLFDNNFMNQLSLFMIFSSYVFIIYAKVTFKKNKLITMLFILFIILGIVLSIIFILNCISCINGLRNCG